MAGRSRKLLDEYRWLLRDIRNLALIPLFIGVFYGTGQFIGRKYLAARLGRLIIEKLP